MSATGGGFSANGVNISVFNARVAPVGVGHEAAAELVDLMQAAANGQQGDIMLDEEPTIADQVKRHVLEIRAATPALLLEAFDDMKALLLSGTLTIVYDDLPTRLRIGRCTGFELIYPAGPSQGAYECQVAVTLSLRPFSYACDARCALSPSLVGLFVGIRSPLPSGSAPSDLTFILHGGGANFTGYSIVIRDKGGNEVFRFVGAGEVTAQERLVIQSAIARIQKIDGSDSSVADAYEHWDRTVTDETNDFPVLRVGDAHVPASHWATAELEAGSAGTPRGTVEHVEAWQ